MSDHQTTEFVEAELPLERPALGSSTSRINHVLCKCRYRHGAYRSSDIIGRENRVLIVSANCRRE